MRHATLCTGHRVKILLFVGTALGACLLAIIQDVTFTNADVLRGVGQEFYAIVAAVVGGCCSLAAMVRPSAPCSGRWSLHRRGGHSSSRALMLTGTRLSLD